MLTQTEFTEFISAVGRRVRLKNPNKFHKLYGAYNGELEVYGFTCQRLNGKNVFQYHLEYPDNRHGGLIIDVDEVEFI